MILLPRQQSAVTHARSGPSGPLRRPARLHRRLLARGCGGKLAAPKPRACVCARARSRTPPCGPACVRLLAERVMRGAETSNVTGGLRGCFRQADKAEDATLPWLIYLQGGPGFEVRAVSPPRPSRGARMAPRPALTGRWAGCSAHAAGSGLLGSARVMRRSARAEPPPVGCGDAHGRSPLLGVAMQGPAPPRGARKAATSCGADSSAAADSSRIRRYTLWSPGCGSRAVPARPRSRQGLLKRAGGSKPPPRSSGSACWTSAAPETAAG